MTNIKRSNIILNANPKRVILLYNNLGLDTYFTDSRAPKLIERILNLSDKEVVQIYEEVSLNFIHRHRKLKESFLKHYANVKHLIPKDFEVSEPRKLLIGAYFTKEY